MITGLLGQSARGILGFALLVGILGSATSLAFAQRILVQPEMFPEQGGEAIYKGVCQACHMPDAKGGVGAGMYPALAGDPKLAIAGYPIEYPVLEVCGMKQCLAVLRNPIRACSTSP